MLASFISKVVALFAGKSEAARLDKARVNMALIRPRNDKERALCAGWNNGEAYL